MIITVLRGDQSAGQNPAYVFLSPAIKIKNPSMNYSSRGVFVFVRFKLFIDAQILFRLDYINGCFDYGVGIQRNTVYAALY